MGNLAQKVINNAQTVDDGGVIAAILENVQLFNNSRLSYDVMPYMKTPRFSGGYIAALVFGIIWILALCLVTVCLWYFSNSRNYSGKEKYSIRRFSKKMLNSSKSDKWTNDYCLTMLTLVLVIIVWLVILIFLFLSIFSIHQLRIAISRSSNSVLPNSTSPPTSILPALKVSLSEIRHYLSTFPSEARRNSAPIVEDIIRATKKMQNETMTSFNAVLMREIGVAKTFEYGAKMTEIVLMYFDYSTELLAYEAEYKKVMSTLFPNDMDSKFSLFQFIRDIRDSFAGLKICDSDCSDYQQFFKKRFTKVESFPDTGFATSFLFIMDKQNKSRQSVIAQTEHGKNEMKKTMLKTQKRMNQLLDIPGTIRNMTGETWTKMEHDMAKALLKLDRIDSLLGSDRTAHSVNKYSSLLVVILVIPIVIALVIMCILVIVILSFWLDKPTAIEFTMRKASFFCPVLLCIPLIFSMILFLYGGKFETELCRYLRTEQPVKSQSELVLDKYINRFLADVLPKVAASMPKSEFPLPMPKNVMYGIIHRCRNNEPILAAIDAISSMDTRALSKPEVSEKFTSIGRFLLIESLNETDPKKMLPPNMSDSLKEASQLDMFKKININECIARIPMSPLIEEFEGGAVKKAVSIAIFMDRVDKYLSTYLINLNDQDKAKQLSSQYIKIQEALQNFKIVTDKVHVVFKAIEKIPPIEPVVGVMKTSLESMLKLMADKPELLKIANSLFNTTIVAHTPQKAADIMAEFGPKMMGVLGHCRPIFNAYRASIDTTCNVVVSHVNEFWFYLGALVLFINLFSIIVFSLLIRSINFNKNRAHCDQTKMEKSVNSPISQPLCEISPTDNSEKTSI